MLYEKDDEKDRDGSNPMNDNPVEDDLPFANRVQELHELTMSDDSWYIYAPAGMGKTRLLKKLNENLLEPKPDRKGAEWFTAWVRFGTDTGAEKSSEAVLKALISSGRPLLDPIGRKKKSQKETTKEDLLEHLLRIATQNNRRRLALFLDAIEKADQSVIEYLERDLIPDIRSRRGRIDCLRVFVSARWRRSSTSGKTGLTPNEMWLSPFRQQDLCDVLRYQNPDMKEEIQGTLAWHLLELCRGHPKSVSRILQHVGQYPRLDDHGRLSNHEQLFNTIVKPTIEDEILLHARKDANIENRPLESIFTLRLLNPIHLRGCLQADEVLAPFELHEKGKDTELYRQVQGTRLVDLSNNQSNTLGQAMDPVVRHFFSMSLMYQDKDRHRELHERAFNYYKRQLEDNNENEWFAGNTLLLTATEALYHYCCMLLTPSPENGHNLTSVKQCIDSWHDKWRCGNIDKDCLAEEWLARIKRDPDLPLLLRMLLGENGDNSLRKHIAETVICGEQPEVNEEAQQ